MTAIHSGPFHPHDETHCDWRHDSFGQHLRCDDRPIPGTTLCADHLIDSLAGSLGVDLDSDSSGWHVERVS